MQGIETIDWLYRWNEPSLALLMKMDNANEAVLYGTDGSMDSTAMVDLLNELGVVFEYRLVDRDPAAMREWEQLDGESFPVLRIGKNSIVRGLDRIKVQQLIGWVGC
jgi:glutaredoxin